MTLLTKVINLVTEYNYGVNIGVFKILGKWLCD